MLKKKETYVRNAVIKSVTDGDTVVLAVDLGCDIKIVMKCRLDGINAPEKNTPEGKISKAWLEQTLPINQAVIVQTVQDKKEKFGRYLAVIYTEEFKDSVNATMITKGLAVEYHGEKRV